MKKPVWVFLCLVAYTDGFIGSGDVLRLVASTAKARGCTSLEGKGPLEDERLTRQAQLQKQFATGEELKRLRADLDQLRDNLKWAKAMDNDDDRVFELTKAIRNGEQRDPDVAYGKSLKLIAETKASTDMSSEDKQLIIQRLQERAQAARSLLPRFQLEGLWLGNYGDHGQELVNVTYAADTMVATKVTGDVNVPRGQVSFVADLAPRNNSLSPLKLTLDQSSQTARQLPRFPGQGHVAKRGFKSPKYIEGQLVLFERHFSFVWLETRHHVLFQRPTPEQTIAMLRDEISREDEIENMRYHLQRCFESDLTECLARQQARGVPADHFRRIPSTGDLKALKAQENKENRLLGLFFPFKWIDGMLHRDDRSAKRKSDL